MPVDVPKFIQENARRGLKYYADGKGGDGLVPATIREARDMAKGYISKNKPKKMAAWFARHKSDLDTPRNTDPNHEDFPGAGAVAFLLWGGNPSSSDPMRAARWAERKAAELEAERKQPMNFERRTAYEAVEIRQDENEENTFRAVGYAATFNNLSQNLGGFVEQVAPNAFNQTLNQADVRALFNHEPDLLLGRTGAGTLRLSTDARGLKYEIDLPDTTAGRDVAELLRRGDVVGSSFGFVVHEDSWGETDSGYPLRTLESVALRDVGPVTFPAYTSTEASLRTLAEARAVDVDELVEAAEANQLGDFLKTDETEATPNESGATNSRPSPSAFIR